MIPVPAAVVRSTSSAADANNECKILDFLKDKAPVVALYPVFKSFNLKARGWYAERQVMV